MKAFLRVFAVMFFSCCFIPSAVSQKKSVAAKPTQSTQPIQLICEHKCDSLLMRINALLEVNNEGLKSLDNNSNLKSRYKLYPTDNIYTLLQLDTQTGRIQQVQWSLEAEKEFTMVINAEDLSYGYNFGAGSFELYPTKNMYQFILLDTTDGRKWHVQWGIGEQKRWIRRIY